VLCHLISHCNPLSHAGDTANTVSHTVPAATTKTLSHYSVRALPIEIQSLPAPTVALFYPYIDYFIIYVLLLHISA